jgi:hypothetical protein
MTRYPKRSHFKLKIPLRLRKLPCVLHVPSISFHSFYGPIVLYSPHTKGSPLSDILQSPVTPSHVQTKSFNDFRLKEQV